MSRQATDASQIPLSSLRPVLDGGWPIGSGWRAYGDGEAPGSVNQTAGTVLAFRLRNAGGGRLRSRVSLPPEANVGLTGLVRVRAVLCGGGRRSVIWSGVLGSIGGRPAPRRLDLDAPLPATGAETVELLLCASRTKARKGGPARVRWSNPAIEVAQGPRLEAFAADVPASDEDPANVPSPVTEDGRPLFSILTPVHNPGPRILEEMLDSVRNQSFEDWELRLVDDGSTDPSVLPILERACAEDSRIYLERHERAGGISVATNTALKSATGTYVALLDHDDVLAGDALGTVAATIAERPEVDMLYSDEDVFDEGQRLALFRKPSWSPDLMRSHMYTCHLGVYRRSLAEEIGGFRPKFDGSQDYDFVLRLSELTDRIVHIPKVLYHWRSHKGSVAENLAAKPHAFAAARRAIAEQLDRTGAEAEVHFDAQRCWYRVDYPTDPAAPVALVLPVAAADTEQLSALRRAAESWLRTPELRWELVLVGPAAVLDSCEDCLPEAVHRDRLVSVRTDARGRGALLSRALAATATERLVLLDTPVEPLTTNWLSRLAGFAAQPDVGAIGAKGLAPDGRVEHAGIVLRDGLPTPIQVAADQIEPGPMAILQVMGNFCAVSGTVATSRETVDRVGGFDERFDQLAVIDFCLRAWSQGLRIVSAPDTVLRRTDGEGPVNDLDELVDFRARWRGTIDEDPYFGPKVSAALTGTGAFA